jgi:hypothetical protein
MITRRPTLRARWHRIIGAYNNHDHAKTNTACPRYLRLRLGTGSQLAAYALHAATQSGHCPVEPWRSHAVVLSSHFRTVKIETADYSDSHPCPAVTRQDVIVNAGATSATGTAWWLHGRPSLGSRTHKSRQSARERNRSLLSTRTAPVHSCLPPLPHSPSRCSWATFGSRRETS